MIYTYMNINIKKNITKCISYNAMGKSLFLKTILHTQEKMYCNNNNLSTSQKKKNYYQIHNKKVWLLDEPYTTLDFYNYIYLKTIVIEHYNKNGFLIYTENKFLNKYKLFYFYHSIYWI